MPLSYYMQVCEPFLGTCSSPLTIDVNRGSRDGMFHRIVRKPPSKLDGYTSSTIEHILFALLLHPEVQRHAHQQIVNVLGRKRVPDFGDRENMPYIEHVVQQGTRYPLIPFLLHKLILVTAKMASSCTTPYTVYPTVLYLPSLTFTNGRGRFQRPTRLYVVPSNRVWPSQSRMLSYTP